MEGLRGIGEAPWVDDAEEVGPVAEVIEEVVLFLLAEGIPPNGKQDDALWALQEVKLEGMGADKVDCNGDIQDAQCVDKPLEEGHFFLRWVFLLGGWLDGVLWGIDGLWLVPQALIDVLNQGVLRVGAHGWDAGVLNESLEILLGR